MYIIHDEDLLRRRRPIKIGICGVQEDHHLIAIRKGSAPSVRLACAEAVLWHGSVAINALDCFAACILAERNDGRIVDDGQCRRVRFAEVIAKEQR